MKWLRRSIALAITTACAGAVSVAPASADAVEYQITPHDGVVWSVAGSTADDLSFAEWDGLGRPAPATAPLRYLSYDWSPSVYAQTTWANPAPRTTPLTAEQWQASGSPAPERATWIDGTYVYKWSTSDQVGVVEPSGRYHWLSEQEWVAMGSPSPEVRGNEGFAKLSWDSSIARMTDVAGGRGSPISYATWVAENRPAPQQVTRFPGDQFTRTIGSDDVRYSGPTMSKVITASQWAAAGSPAPSLSLAPGSYVYQWATSDQVGVVDPSGGYHWMTPEEWRAVGSPTPQHRANEGFAKLSWSNEIARMTNLAAGQGSPVSDAAWAAENFPEPLQVTRFAGDAFYRNAGSSTIYYEGPTMNRAISAAEWRAAGSPAPEVRGSVSSGISDATWAALAKCESGGNPRIVSASGSYHGLYQFSVSTWRSVGGTGLPSQASAEEQTERARLLQARSGWGQWPHCSRVIGVR